MLPVLYCLLDALGTYGDGLVINSLGEEEANTAYELTFFVCGIASFIYTRFICKEKFSIKSELPKYCGAIFETAGQYAYVYAIGDEAHRVFSAPIISSYCAVSVIWGRLFLKEKLTWKHYICIVLIVAGIAILGFYDV